MGLIRRRLPLHGRSDWAGDREIRRAGLGWRRVPPGDALVLGRRGAGPFRRYLCMGEGHAALYAMTGAGKTAGFVIPNLLSWSGSVVAFDVKGELWRRTAGARRRAGHDVFLFSPGTTDGRSHRYNPYSVVAGGEAGRIDMIHRIGSILVPPNPDVKDPFWINTSRNAINGAATILAETPGEALNVAAIRRAFGHPDWRDRWRGLVARARQAGRPYPLAATDAVLSVVEMQDDRGREGICKEIQSHLGLWASPTVAAATEASDFDLRDLRRRPMAVYLGIRPTDLRRFRPLTTLLFQQILDLSTESEWDQDPAHRCRLLMMLDEFAAMGRMDMLADAAAFVRSYGVRMAYVMQSKAQMESIYGKEGADNLFENTAAEVVMGAKGLRAAKEASQMAGNDTVRKASLSRPRLFGRINLARQTESESESGRALALPQEIQRMDPRREIVYRAGIQPVSCRRVAYWKDPTFRDLERPPPRVPELVVAVPRDGAGRATTAPSRAPATVP